MKRMEATVEENWSDTDRRSRAMGLDLPWFNQHRTAMSTTRPEIKMIWLTWTHLAQHRITHSMISDATRRLGST